jgi:hypothetical protein
MWGLLHLTTVLTSTACYRDIFTFFTLYIKQTPWPESASELYIYLVSFLYMSTCIVKISFNMVKPIKMVFCQWKCQGLTKRYQYQEIYTYLRVHCNLQQVLKQNCSPIKPFKWWAVTGSCQVSFCSEYFLHFTNISNLLFLKLKTHQYHSQLIITVFLETIKLH